MFVSSVNPTSPYFSKQLQSKQDGLIAIGGHLSKEILLEAYSKGIFPWYQQPPILWYCPNERIIVQPENFILPKSLKKIIKNNTFNVSFDTAFQDVINACAQTSRKNQKDTWINQDMIKAYIKLHQQGIAHSIEIYQKNKLIGGLYGLAINSCFFGESMFHLISNASKVAFYYLVQISIKKKISLIDCQTTDAKHLLSLGGTIASREKFEILLKKKIKEKRKSCLWTDFSLKET